MLLLGCGCLDTIRSVSCIFLWSDQPLTIGFLDVKYQPISMQKKLRDAYAMGKVHTARIQMVTERTQSEY